MYIYYRCPLCASFILNLYCASSNDDKVHEGDTYNRTDSFVTLETGISANFDVRRNVVWRVRLIESTTSIGSRVTNLGRG